MNYALVLTAAGALILAAQMNQSFAQTSSEPAAPEATKSPLKLSEQEKAAVIRAVFEAKSHQETPKQFTPAVGASVPKEVYVHGFNPEIARQVPVLKQYWYAYLSREVVLIDGLQTKVVAVIPLPTPSESVGQGHNGAAEPASESKNKDGASSTESVPAYTSPETIK